MGTGLTVSLPSYCRHHMPNVAGSWQHWRQGRGPPKTESLPRHSNLAPSSGSSLSGVYSLPDLEDPERSYLEIGRDDESIKSYKIIHQMIAIFQELKFAS